MVLRTGSVFYDKDIGRFSWSGLRRFHNVPWVADNLMCIHRIPSKQKSNAVKQATQIRQCLIQSKEYRDAAQVTTLVTKPVLLYYSLLSLALSQILFSGTGADSLDAARGEHAHHGLIFSAASPQRDAFGLREAASSLVARPMVDGIRRRGTFELWHRIAREDPVIGKLTTSQASGSFQQPGQVFFTAHNSRMGYLQTTGISFLDCLVGMPGMIYWLHHHGILSEIVRASIQAQIVGDIYHSILTVHPNTPARIQQLQDDIIIRPSDHGKIQVSEITNAFVMHVNESLTDRSSISFPPCVSWNTDEIRFLPSKSVLNEFGFIYVGLYILGNYARYFPDRWTLDVETGSSLALAAEEFISLAEWRMAQLALSELSQTYFLPAA